MMEMNDAGRIVKIVGFFGELECKWSDPNISIPQPSNCWMTAMWDNATMSHLWIKISNGRRSAFRCISNEPPQGGRLLTVRI